MRCCCSSPVGFAVCHAQVHGECEARAAARAKLEAARAVLAGGDPEGLAAARPDEEAK